jgi:cephalosporin-C deacetylase-like acetyl esterase
MTALKRALCLFIFPLAFVASVDAASSWDGKKAVDYILSVETDRPAAIYKQGETVTYKIELLHQQKPAADQTIDYIVSKDGVAPLQKGTVTLKNGVATVTGTLNEPGFLRCQVTFKDGKELFTAFAGAGFDPEKIQPSMPRPADFDAFWDEQLKRLAAVPINPRLTPVPAPADRPGIEVFDLQADCIGAPVSGFYSRPIGAKPGSHPARLYVDGAGVRRTDLLASARWAGRGVLSLSINAHGIPNDQPGEFYSELDRGALRNYRKEGRESRDTYYFLGMFLRVKRALDFLASQPEWDGRILMIEGGSQGGGQAMAGAALDPRVTFYTAMVTALCDHTGMVAGRAAGWPQVVPVKDGVPDPAVLEASRYFDMVNFAPRIKARGYFWVGFFDNLCPPTTVYAAYNQLKAPKEIIHAVDSGHGLDGMKLWPAVAAVQQKHVDEMKAKAASNP